MNTNIYVYRRVDAAWKEYITEVRRTLAIDQAPDSVKNRFASMEEVLEAAFKHGAAAGTRISAEAAEFIGQS